MKNNGSFKQLNLLWVFLGGEGFFFVFTSTVPFKFFLTSLHGIFKGTNRKGIFINRKQGDFFSFYYKLT